MGAIIAVAVILGIIFWSVVIIIIIKVLSKGNEYTNSVIEKNKAIKEDLSNKNNKDYSIQELEEKIKKLELEKKLKELEEDNQDK